MKNQFLWILIILLVLLILINFFMPTSYYDSGINSTSARPVFNKAFIQNILVENDKLQSEFFSPQSTAVYGNKTPLPRIFIVVMKKLLTLNDAELEKLNLIASKTNGLPQPRPTTPPLLAKLLLAGDIRGFVNSFSDSDIENINEDVIVSKAKQFSGPDIVAYRQAIDLVLSDPLLTDPRAVPLEIGNMIRNDLVILKNLDDTRLITFMYLIENQLVQPGELVLLIPSPNFSPFLDVMYTKIKQGSINRDYVASLLAKQSTESPIEQKQLSTMVQNAIQSNSSMPVIQTVIKQITSSSSRAPGRPRVPTPKAPAKAVSSPTSYRPSVPLPVPRAPPPAPKAVSSPTSYRPSVPLPVPRAPPPAPKAVSSPTSYRPSVKKVMAKCRPPGSMKFWLKKC